MKSKDIQQGETYMFVATDSPTRKHLEGQPFEVVQVKDVWRKLGRKRKVKRFFNDAGDGARAEELEPMPEREFPCLSCKTGEYGEGERLPNCGERYTCNECGDSRTFP